MAEKKPEPRAKPLSQKQVDRVAEQVKEEVAEDVAAQIASSGAVRGVLPPSEDEVLEAQQAAEQQRAATDAREQKEQR